MHIQGRRNSGRAGGAVIELRAMETFQKQKKNVTNCLFLLSIMLTSKIITKITENHSEVSGCPNSCNKFVQVDLDKP